MVPPLCDGNHSDPFDNSQVDAHCSSNYYNKQSIHPPLPLVHLQILSPLPSKPTSNMLKMETVLQMPSHTPAGWKARCAEYFPYSIHFGGKKTSVVALALNNRMLNASENGTLNQEPESRDSSLNGKLQALAIK